MVKTSTESCSKILIYRYVPMLENSNQKDILFKVRGEGERREGEEGKKGKRKKKKKTGRKE